MISRYTNSYFCFCVEMAVYSRLFSNSVQFILYCLTRSKDTGLALFICCGKGDRSNKTIHHAIVVQHLVWWSDLHSLCCPIFSWKNRRERDDGNVSSPPRGIQYGQCLATGPPPLNRLTRSHCDGANTCSAPGPVYCPAQDDVKGHKINVVQN